MSSVAGDRLLGAAAGLLVDRLAGEPPAVVHPVAAFGRLMTSLEQRMWADSRLAGAAFAVAGTGTGAAAGALAGSTALTTATAVAGRALAEEARRVAGALAAGDLPAARRLVPALVGRDAGSLDEKAVVRAVIESVAENTVDAVVAPALWGALFGAPGAAGYRAVNTLDAMVGHHSARYRHFGWAAARLDDAANWLPARLTALLVAAVRPGSGDEVFEVLRHPPEHRSRNAAVSEGAFAAALDIRLGGDAVYGGRVDSRPSFGTGRTPGIGDIEAAVRLSRDVTAALGAGLAVLGGARAALRRRRRAPSSVPHPRHAGVRNAESAAQATATPTSVPHPRHAGARNAESAGRRA